MGHAMEPAASIPDCERSIVSFAHVGPAPKIILISTVDLSMRYMLLGYMLFLKELGYDILGLSAPGPEIEHVEAAGIRHISVDMTRRITPLRDILSLVGIYRVLRRERPQIVHTHTPKASLLGQLAARMARVPIVVNTVHGLYFHEGMSAAMAKAFVAVERVAASCSDEIFFVSREDVKTAERLRIARSSRLLHIGNGISIERFDPKTVTREAKERLRAQLGISADAPVVGFVGRLVREKGVLDLLAATAEIKNRFPMVRFLMVGPVDAEKRDAITPAIAADFGISEACVFTGMRQDMPELFAIMDVFVLPSYREGVPRTPMEACSMGVPCVVTDVRGCREVVTNGVNGFVVPPRCPAEIARSVMAILQDPALAKRLATECLRTSRAEFDEVPIFKFQAQRYEQLLRQKGIPFRMSNHIDGRA